MVAFAAQQAAVGLWCVRRVRQGSTLSDQRPKGHKPAPKTKDQKTQRPNDKYHKTQKIDKKIMTIRIILPILHRLTDINTKTIELFRNQTLENGISKVSKDWSIY